MKRYPVIILCSFFCALFAAMLVYICVYAYTNREVLTDNSYNSRTRIIEKQNRRGTIYSRGGEVLAFSEDSETGEDVRNYPYGREFSHVVGYSTHGRMGVESLMNYELIHTSLNIAEKLEAGQSGEKYPGNDVSTTLDVKLQETAYEALSARRGAIVVTDVRTGDILAMVSKPDFDPGAVSSMWSELTADSEDSRLLNRATQGLYPPGSTFKIITALEYLKENDCDLSSYSYNCTGSFSADGETIRCFHSQVHGKLDFETSFAKSCNSSFANIGTILDKEKFSDTLSQLLFGEKLPLDMACSMSSATCDKDTDTAAMLQLSIGQGTTSMTPMHLNMITQAIANGGVLMKPRLISKVTGAAGETVKEFAPSEYKKLMTKEEASCLTDLMEKVVEEGTGKALADSPYRAAGKTGSAEFKENSDDSHAWFTGFAPADDPEIAVTVIVENAGSGSEYAVPVSKRIFDAYFNVE